MINRKVILWASVFTALVVLCTAAFAFKMHTEPSDREIRAIAYAYLPQSLKETLGDWEQADIVESRVFYDYSPLLKDLENNTSVNVNMKGRTVYFVNFKQAVSDDSRISSLSFGIYVDKTSKKVLGLMPPG